MYCVNCGVKLADTEKKCPLCGVEACHPQFPREQVPPMYPENRHPLPQISPRGVLTIVTTLFLLPFFITVLCDYQLSGAVTWSGYVMGGLLVAYGIMVLPFWFRRPNPVVFVPCNAVLVATYVYYIDYVTPGSWFLSFALPVVIFLAAVLTAVVALLRYVRGSGFYVAGGALIALGIFLPVMEYFLVMTFGLRFVGWSWYPMIPLVLAGGTLILLARSAKTKEAMERKFFI